MISNEDLEAHAESMMEQPWWGLFVYDQEVQRRKNDPIRQYVRFIFREWEKDKAGWITKIPPSVAEFMEHENCNHELCNWWED